MTLYNTYMNKNSFVDMAKIKVKAGDGGGGLVSFLRAKFVPKGGPDGGDGGDGGNVYFVAKPNMITLRDFRTRSNYHAENGNPGKRRKMSGRKGADLYLKVPLGTVVYDAGGEEKGRYGQVGLGGAEAEVLIGDLVESEQKLLLAKGGYGGKGNDHFKSSANQAPQKATPGTPGEEKNIRLEVKLIADIGLVGFPNAGKSTLINQLAGTKAKVADYPFTTLSPNLGVCVFGNSQEAIIADLPGLIEGASKGKGLGDEFLRHAERTRLLVHLVDISGEDPEKMPRWALEKYKAIRKELKEYGGNLLEKREIAVVNKIDLPEVRAAVPEIKKEFAALGIEILGISAASGEGMEVLKDQIFKNLEEIPQKPEFDVRKPIRMYTIENLPNRRIIFNRAQDDRGR